MAEDAKRSTRSLNKKNKSEKKRTINILHTLSEIRLQKRKKMEEEIKTYIPVSMSTKFFFFREKLETKNDKAIEFIKYLNGYWKIT